MLARFVNRLEVLVPPTHDLNVILEPPNPSRTPCLAAACVAFGDLFSLEGRDRRLLVTAGTVLLAVRTG